MKQSRLKFKTRLLYLVALTISFFLTSCSKSSDPEPPAFSLLGTWTLINITATGCTDTGLNGNNSNFACPPTTQLQSCSEYTFTSGGSMSEYLGVYYDGDINESYTSGTYSLTGNKLTITSTIAGSASTSTGTASLSGNTLTINWSKSSVSECVSVYTLVKS